MLHYFAPCAVWMIYKRTLKCMGHLLITEETKSAYNILEENFNESYDLEYGKNNREIGCLNVN
jgi:hypothetical protein